MRISDWSSDVCSSDLGLSATIADPAQYAAWLAPDSRGETVTIVEGEAGADPDIEILLPEGAVPWAGHSGRWAVHPVMEVIARNRPTIIFCNTPGLAARILQELWKDNDLLLQPAIEHGRSEARRVGKELSRTC